ncbi:MAG: DUF4403 family protein, partial [Cytophagales bacterium]|nr:DUF4403 family protein [Cytophagales bacterium]
MKNQVFGKSSSVQPVDSESILNTYISFSFPICNSGFPSILLTQLKSKNPFQSLNRWVIPICALLSIGILAGCTSTKSNILPKSPEVYHNPVPDLPMSRFSIPVKFLISALEHEVNNHVGEVLYEDDNAMDDNIILKVIKSGRLTLHPQGKIITYKLPIRIEAEYHPTPGSTTNNQQVSCELMIDFSSSFAVGSDWELIPHTEYNGFEWITKPAQPIGKNHKDLTSWIEAA